MTKRVARDRARAEILGGEHAAGGHDPDERVEVGDRRVFARIERGCESAGRGRVEGEALALAEDVLEHVKVGGRWRAVTTEDGRLRETLVDAVGHADVGEEHELLDEAVGLELLLGLDVDRTGRLGRVEMDLDLRRGEVEGAGGHALGPELDRDRVEEPDPLSQRVRLRRVILAVLRGLVGEGGLAGDDRLCEPDADDVGVLVEFLRGQWRRRLCRRTQKTEKARRSTYGRSEHRLVPRSEGSMSMRLSTR